MARVEDRHLIRSKHKAINALLPYAVLCERDGQPEMLDAFLHAAGASKMLKFGWSRARQYASTVLSKSSPRALALASPHVRWEFLTDRGDLVQQWAAATSMVPCTERVTQCVVDALLQIASQDGLFPHIPADTWSWLVKGPSLPPVCHGRDIGACQYLARAIRGFGDIEITKSYLLLIWSEWDYLASGGFDESCSSIREDFGGVGNGHHRAELTQRLDHILAQLDRGLEYLQQHNPNVGERDFRMMRDQYRKLMDILLETNIEAVARTSNPMTVLLRMLTHADVRRISCNDHVRASAPVSLVLCLEPSISSALFRGFLYPGIYPGIYPGYGTTMPDFSCSFLVVLAKTSLVVLVQKCSSIGIY